MNQTNSSADTYRAAWPTAVGLICMIYGFFSLVINVWGILRPWMKGPMARMTEEPPPPLPFGLMMLVILGGAGGVLLAMLLMFGGLNLMRRKVWGVFVLKSWVAMKFLEVAIAAGCSYALLDSMVEHQLKMQEYELMIFAENNGDIEKYDKVSKADMRSLALTGSLMSMPFVLIWPATVWVVLSSRARKKQILNW